MGSFRVSYKGSFDSELHIYYHSCGFKPLKTKIRMGFSDLIRQR